MLYNITSKIQTNMVLNKGLLEIGGIAIPNTIMANNKTEARERAERESLFFGLAFLAPFVFLPFFNRAFLKLSGISSSLKGHEYKIMHMSKKYLAKDTKYLADGINETLNKFKNNKDYSQINSAFQRILNKFPDNKDREILRRKLIETHSNILLSDFILSGLLISSIPWLSNLITQKRTGKAGFSAKFKMVDAKTLQNDAKKHEQTKLKKLAALIGTIIFSGTAVCLTLKHGLLTKKSNTFINFIKNNADKFDYKDSIFMSRTILLLITLFADMPSTILSSRDKEEVKYNTTKNLILNGIFFGGDIILNNTAAQIIDKTLGTKLLDDSKLQVKNNLLNKITQPLRTFEDIHKNEIELNAKALRLTQKAGVWMFWGNFIILCTILGFGLPYMLNQNLKKNLKKEKKLNQTSQEYNYTNLKIDKSIKDFLSKSA